MLDLVSRTPVPPRSAEKRDRGRRRVSYLTRWVAAGGVAAVGLFSGLAARASTPHTTTSQSNASPPQSPSATPAAPVDPAAQTAPASPAAGVQNVDPNAPSLQSPDQAPVQIQAPPPPPMVVSGGS